ncbi:MAG: hypothetical protein ACRBEQ_00215 [Hyphomonas sp.]
MTKLFTTAAVAALFAGAAIAMEPPVEAVEAVEAATTEAVEVEVTEAVEADVAEVIEAQGDGEAEVVETEVEAEEATEVEAVEVEVTAEAAE